MLTIYHLEHSRSERIVWLAEEMGLDYRLVSFKRDPQTHRAPDKLKALTPLGRVPFIEDGDVKLSESGAIVTWILEKYGAKTSDGASLRPDVKAPEFPAYTHWMFAAESTLMTAPITDLLTQMTQARSPALEGLLKNEYHLILGLLEDILSKQDYIAGNNFSAADIMIAFPLRFMGLRDVFPGIRLLPNLEDYPAIKTYLGRVLSRPAWQKTLEKIRE
ncbi:glutathione S-transferase [Acetobacteraceae bacterium]|nr:glutathione S-transferase [Acetobacteraceae bacterium]